jgi:hypothetical protein
MGEMPTSRTQKALATLNAALGGRYLIEREIGSGGMATVYLRAISSTSGPSR